MAENSWPRALRARCRWMLRQETFSLRKRITDQEVDSNLEKIEETVWRSLEQVGPEELPKAADMRERTIRILMRKALDAIVDPD